MEKEKLKRLILFIGALFVAVIFISSYASFSNNSGNGGSTSTTTLKQQSTYLVYGNANAIVINYSYVAGIFNVNVSESNTINATLGNLQLNGSVSNYLFQNSTYRVELDTISPYTLYLLISNTINGSNATVGATAYVKLPSAIVAYYGSSPVSVALQKSNYSIFLNSVEPINTIIPLKVTALISGNGSVYDNQVELSILSLPKIPANGIMVNTNTITANSTSTQNGNATS